MKISFQPGINNLLTPYNKFLRNKLIGLVTHQSAVDYTGKNTADILRNNKHIKLRALFGPEHGFWTTAGAGDHVATRKHPSWKIPVYSLYGNTRRPSSSMLKNLDVLIVDLQDLGARPYTYVSTLLYVMEEACLHQKQVIVADRPIPLPRVIDGPMLNPAFKSFIGSINTPMLYSMTQGETALWLKRSLNLPVDLKVAKMKNYHREPARQPDWPAWIPSSPGIPSWESATTYLTTVFCEALTSVDFGRGTPMPFQLLGSQWIKPEALCEELNSIPLRGVRFYPHHFIPGTGPCAAQPLNGIRITVTDRNIFRPVTAAVCILSSLQKNMGRKRLWNTPGSRYEHFDKLFGTDTVRKAIMDGVSGTTLAKSWQYDLNAFQKTRRPNLLYQPR